MRLLLDDLLTKRSREFMIPVPDSKLCPHFFKVDENTCVIDGTIDGLDPNSDHGLAVHEVE